ncbi:MaoC family dehydratase [Actinoalloteichus hymeniacidonis]|uniref:Acyl dehydratase n=1 Tax=Actinoalloteichus hymeniacidonis TaxID=340345 RepID=A0AAC9HQ99_9PSEU|nr:MaoC family dehydratase [Actinoalloteichus hymeniacidonis]AOS63338.1 acyl dehydratase [Actinoalloteichus hymeniacidonis]MBB5908622.1 acyl dehydratase [Actinoalloteichus hymeniacidonis]
MSVPEDPSAASEEAPPVRVFASLAELAGAVGEVLGPGQWQPIEQDRVDAFAEATGDRQWIHTDPQRAAAGPFGGTVAHGYLMLSLLPMLNRSLYRVASLRTGINYGLNKVRFPAPLRTGSAVRVTSRIDEATPLDAGSLQLVATVTVEVRDGERPCCVAQTVSRLYEDT